MDIIKIDEKAAEKKLSIIRRYIFEILIVVLCFLTGYLFQGQRELETMFREYLVKDRMLMMEKIDVNTSVINQNSSIIQDLNKSLYSKSKK